MKNALAELKIAVVILNWNGKVLLEQFLPSVMAFSENAAIYVADNASSDDSVSFIKSNFPRIKIIKNLNNDGFAKGYNDALKQVEATIYCLLNNDVEVTEHWLMPIIKTFSENPNTAIIQPKLLDFNKRNYFEYAGAAGGFIDKYGFPYCRGRIFNTIEKDTGQYHDVANIFWASGACFFIRSSVFKALHGFDATFYAHFEEIDLCWRAKNLGYDIMYVGQSTVYHVGGATLSNNDSKKTFLNFRNSLFALTKNAKGTLFLILFVRLLFDGIAGLKFLLDLKPKHTLAILKAHGSFYYYLNSVLKKRRATKQKTIYYHKKSVVIDYFLCKNSIYKP